MNDYFSLIFDGIQQMLNQQADFFQKEGLTLFKSFTIILFSWFGIQSALAAAENGDGFRWGRFSMLLWEVLLVYTLLAFYTIPIPGIGISFTHLILDQATYLIGRLNQNRIQEIIETLNAVESSMPYPSPFEIMSIFRFFILFISVLLAQAVTLFVVMFGYVATAVLVLLGPLFIPFKLVPQMDWMFWGWLRAFIQYAFYQVVASAYVFIFGNFLLQFLGAKTAPMSNDAFAANFVPLVLVLVVFILGIVKIPSLVFSLFAGRSGDHVFPTWR